MTPLASMMNSSTHADGLHARVGEDSVHASMTDYPTHIYDGSACVNEGPFTCIDGHLACRQGPLTRVNLDFTRLDDGLLRKSGSIKLDCFPPPYPTKFTYRYYTLLLQRRLLR